MTSPDIDSDRPTRFEGSVLSITIARADNGCSFDPEGIAEGTRALEAFGWEIGSVLLVGTGANFCAGGNVAAFGAAPDRGERLAADAALLHRFVRALAATPAPIVAGVQGWAAGAGMSLVCLADIALGGPSTQLRPAYSSIGFTPDGGLSWTLPRIVGHARARQILLGDETIAADEAARLGILHRIVGDELVQSEALRVARTMAAGPTSAYQGTKRLLAASPAASLDEQLDAEAASIVEAAESSVGREGVDAFLAKRRPDFTTAKSQPESGEVVEPGEAPA
ncbi:enoyl-CoA hydratase/isomerase family protein [Rhodococcus rhodnii]|uniref:Enoyl-CoA hydratase n=1 Tax=Rhodococcus rhodnii LMG 5362 TaxID=1273125 RepID=R7WIN6_9NOCA|nr:enoyl-CoA hydratase-related protein [Rhodococcus rhodnii]EOM75071.1 enoyl-CoA hydratase [Rhodococcus rhodnii LMG 5362]